MDNNRDPIIADKIHPFNHLLPPHIAFFPLSSGGHFSSDTFLQMSEREPFADDFCTVLTLCEERWIDGTKNKILYI